MLNLIQGGSKSGKSHTIFDKIAEFSGYINEGGDSYDSQPLLLIVPEQFSFEAERALFEKVGGKSFLNIKVTSFTRLAYEIFKAYGGLAGTYADDCAKTILMNQAINISSEDLNIYKKASKYTSLTSKMIAIINEMKMSGITYEDISNSCNDIQNDDFLKEKISEISTIYTNYEAILGEKDYIDHTGDLTRALKLIQDNNMDFFKDKYIFIDEFKGFTHVEYIWIKSMIAVAEEVYVSLCIDATRKEIGQLSPFASILTTKEELKALVDNKSNIEEVILKKTYYQNSQLNHLEKNIFTHVPQEYVSTTEKSNINIIECDEEYQELEYVSSTIKHLVSSNEYCYNDIAVISRDTDLYESIYEGIFDKYDIPIFYDQVVSVTQMPLIRFVQAFLNCIVNGVTPQNLLSMLKCELVPFSFYEVASFENYIFTWNITKISDWKKEFTQSVKGYGSRNLPQSVKTITPTEEVTPEQQAVLDEQNKQSLLEQQELENINLIREYCINHISKFKNQTKDSSSIEFSQAVMETVVSMGIKDKLELQINDFLTSEPKELEKAEEYSRVWEIFNELLSTIGNSIGKELISAKQFNDLFGLVASTYDMGNVQQSLDCVTFGCADRIRIDNKKVVFVLSVNDTIFPLTPVNNSLLSSRERDVLSSLSLPIPKVGIDKIKEERFIAYKTITSPTHELYISYLRKSTKGDDLLPSPVIKELTSIFGNDIAQTTADLPLSYFCHNDTSTLKQYLLKTNMEDTQKESFKQILENIPTTKIKLDSLDKIKSNQGFAISNLDIALKLFHENMVLSSTKIDTLSKCPFMYFCRYGLNILPLTKIEMSALNSGNLIHNVLDKTIKSSQFMSAVNTNAPLDDVVINISIASHIEEFIQTEFGGTDFKTDRFLYLCERMQKSIYDIVERIYNEFTVSKFRPSVFEANIGYGDDADFYPLVINRDDGRKITVIGKIDRVDCYKSNTEKYIRIIDYKSGSTAFDLNDVFNSLNTQMLLYLQATTNGAKIEELKNSLPAGILYMPVGEESPDENDLTVEEEIKSKYLSSYQMSGLIVNDPPELINAMEEPAEVTDKKGNTSLEYQYIPQIKLNGKKIDKSLVTPQQLKHINDYINTKIVNMSKKLHDGKIPASPLHLDNKNKKLPCSYCDYKSVCGNSTLTQEQLRDYIVIKDNETLREKFEEDN